MATRRPIPSARTPRAKAVPIRVVRSSPRPRPIQTVPPKSRSRRAAAFRSADHRRSLMWFGVAVVAVVIFVGWIGFIRSDLSRPGGGDTFWGKIREQVKWLSGRIRPLNLNTNAASSNNVNDGLDEVRNRVFPPIDDQSFMTNQNVNR